MLLAELHGIEDSGEEFVAGLVHDLGKLILYGAYSDRVAENPDRLVGLVGGKILAAERELFGLDHTEAGAWAAEKWRLPANLVRVMREHEMKPGEPSPDDLTHRVHYADHITRWYEGLDHGLPEAVPESWQENPILGHPDLEPARIEEYLTIELGVLQ